MKPTIEELEEFDKEVLPQLRKAFEDGYVTRDRVENLFKPWDESNKSGYVIFTTIPDRLREIITPERAYRISEERNGETKLFLDNDFSHWIGNENLRPCPLDEINTRP